MKETRSSGMQVRWDFGPNLGRFSWREPPTWISSVSLRGVRRRRPALTCLRVGLAVAAAGMGQRGGTEGVVRELVSLRAVARTVLRPNGRPMYRFVGLVDNDRAGRLAVKRAHELDTSIVEYKDMFRLQPVLPIPLDLDPTSLRRRFEWANVAFRSLDWELEDLLPSSLVDAFIEENDGAISSVCGRRG